MHSISGAVTTKSGNTTTKSKEMNVCNYICVNVGIGDQPNLFIPVVFKRINMIAREGQPGSLPVSVETSFKLGNTTACTQLQELKAAMQSVHV